MTKARTRNISASTFTKRPHLPSEKYALRIGLWQILSQAMEPIDSIYDERSATVPSAVSWLKAMAEPKLMHIKRIEKMAVAMTAFKGTFRPGCIYEI